ncbi:MAG: ion transporter [Psychrobium sp.]
MSFARLRRNVSQLIEFNASASTSSRFMDFAMVVLIVANVAAIMLESVASIEAQYASQFWYFEVFSITVFTIEYLLRVWSCPDIKEGKYEDSFRGRLKYMCSIPALIDLAAIAPFYLSLFFVMDLRFLRVFRVFRIFKLTRYSNAMTMLLRVFKEESSSFFAAFSILAIVLITAASGIYLLEHEVQPEAFGSIPAAMWWATATLTTVGYGDVTPITPLGKVFGGLITVVGMGMVALPAGILASGFSAQLKQNRSVYRHKLIESLHDGVIDANEKKHLDLLRRELGITEQEAQLLLFAHSQQQPLHKQCPHCHKDIV